VTTELMKAAQETPLTVEALLWALNQRGCMTVAGYNGSCERVIRFDDLVAALESLRKKA
jgi:hypothetical protein